LNVFGNAQAELGLLASALEYPEVAHQAMALGIRADDFSEERSRVLWRLISKLGESGQPTTFEAMLTSAAAVAAQRCRKLPQPLGLEAALSDPGRANPLCPLWRSYYPMAG